MRDSAHWPRGFERQPDSAPAGAAIAGEAVAVSDEVYTFPLSPAQESLWFMENYLGGGAVFTLNHAYHLNAPVEPALFERALNEIVRRHETLRTRFSMVDGRPVQVVAQDFRVRLPVIDLSGLSPEEAEAESMRLAAEDARTPFHLGRHPLFRARLLQLTSDRWVFLQTMHHIISDGWSIVVFWREMEAILEQLQGGRPSPLPQLPIQYGDFAAWRREWLKTAEFDNQLRYWIEHLAGMTGFELPSDHARPEIGHNFGAIHHFALPQSLVSSLHSVANRGRATLFMTLLAAFYVLLNRYTGETDIAIGSYVAGRNRAELEHLIGLFLNTIILRLRFDGRASFLDVLGRVKEMALEAYAHQDVPFVRLVQELRPERELNRHPFFEAVFQMLNLPPVLEGVNIDLPQLVVHRGAAVFDLTWTVWESGNTIHGHIEYNTELYEPATIARFVEHYKTLLGGIAADPEERISELPFLTLHEQELIRKRNAAEKGRGYHEGLVQLLERQVELAPDAIAVLDGESRTTFGELNSRANRLAHYLTARGTGPQTRAAVCLDPSAEAVTAMLAVLKTGAALVPLDRSSPREHLAAVLKDAGAEFLITTSSAEFPPGAAAALVLLDAEGAQIASESDEYEAAAPEPESLACILYTSGSSGRPKGVAIEHRQILSRLHWMWNAYPFGPGERICQRAPLNFIDALWEIFGALLAGIPMVIIPEDARRELQKFIEVATHAVTRVWVFPSFLRALLDVPGLAESLRTVNFWVSTGEPLSAELAAEFHRQMPHASLFNLYGTSEVWDACLYNTRDLAEAASSVPIGLPIENVRCYILDSEAQPLPAGVTGELYVAGAGVSRGYWKNPQATAEKFIPDAFSNEPGSRLYRTGDLARRRHDGVIEFMGRKDDQVKIRGIRVDLSEVESILNRHPAVAQAAVVADHASGIPRLHACVVLRGDKTAGSSELNTFLKQAMPAYFTPARCSFVERLPLLPNGKLDRVALRREISSSAEFQPHIEEPRTVTEKRIAAVWLSVLNVPKVGLDDSFFDLGGHSLLLMSVHQKLSAKFPVSISVVDLFRHPTIRSLAAFLDRALPLSSGSST